MSKKSERLMTSSKVAEKLSVKPGSLHLRAAQAGITPLQRVVRGRATNFYTVAQVAKIEAAMKKASK